MRASRSVLREAGGATPPAYSPEAAGGHPTAQQLQRDYIDPGSDGLHELAKLRNVSGTPIAEELNKRPEIYSDAKRCMAVLPQVRQRLEVAFHKLGQLYPEAKFPPVTIAVGRGNRWE